MSAEFQDWIIQNGIRHKVSTTYNSEIDGQTERKNRELAEMFAGHELQGTDWPTTADLLFLKQLVVDCTKLIPGMKFSDKQKPHFVTFCKVLNIIDRLSGYAYIITCTGDNNAAGIINIFEEHIQATIGLPFPIVSHQHVLVMSAEFHAWMIKNGIRHKVSTTYHSKTDSYTESKNRVLAEMFAAHDLEGTDWPTAEP